MNIKEYIESGIIGDYCLGLLDEAGRLEVEKNLVLYPELKLELEAYQNALAHYAISFEQRVPGHIREKTLALIDNLAKEENARYDDLPILNRFSNYRNWLKIVRPLLPAELVKEHFVKVLYEDEKLMQVAMWVKSYYPDEVHHDLEECFMILEGECECDVEGEKVNLGPGDFFNIPLHKHHDVKVTRGPVLAVVQRLKVA